MAVICARQGALGAGWRSGLHDNPHMLSARWWTLAVWALAAASALFWGFKIFAKPLPLPSQAQVASPGAAARGDLTRLLGVDPPPPVVVTDEPAPDARFQLIGVVSPRATQAAREGLALIAVDGKPPKAFRVGTVVDGQNVLQTVNARGATLGPRDGAAAVALNLAPQAPAATGTLPSLGLPPGMSQQVQPAQMQPSQMPRQPMQQQAPQQRRATPQNAPMPPRQPATEVQDPNHNGLPTQ